MSSLKQHSIEFPAKKRGAIAALIVVLLWTAALATAAAGSTHAASHPSLQRVQVDPFRKEPYLIFPGDPTQMKVLWQLVATDTSTIQWGADSTYAAGSAQTSLNSVVD